MVRSGAVAERHLPNFRLRVVVGDDGGTERSGSGATPFRILDLGRRLGTMVVPERSFAERHLPNFRLRAAVGDDGGTRAELCGATFSELST